MSRRDRRREKAQKKTGGRASSPPPGFDANAAFQAAVADQKAGRLDAAEAAYRQILAVMPDSAAINSNLAVVLRLLGKLDDALACCRCAVKADPNMGPRDTPPWAPC
jgi:Flp pilus assembly protein TadD